jgi:hypothetical protein
VKPLNSQPAFGRFSMSPKLWKRLRRAEEPRRSPWQTASKMRTGKAAGKVAYLTAMAGHESLDSRDKGFIEGMKAFPEIKVIGNHVANNEEAEGMNRQFAVPRPLC